MGSKISWTDEAWNPVAGCSKVSAGCLNCYAERISLRFKRSEKPWEARFAEENVVLHPERLDKPVRWRVTELRRTPAALRFLSCEPLIGPLDLSPYLRCRVCWTSHKFSPEPCDPVTRFRTPKRTGPGEIGWVIAGGESGPGFRPMEVEWARSLRDQCVAVGVPFFFKQSAGPRPETGTLLDGEEWHQFPEELAAGALSGA